MEIYDLRALVHKYDEWCGRSYVYICDIDICLYCTIMFFPN